MYELTHHGVKGQEWGVQNGPPYPLDPSKLSKKEIKARDKETTKYRNSEIKSAQKSYTKLSKKYTKKVNKAQNKFDKARWAYTDRSKQSLRAEKKLRKAVDKQVVQELTAQTELRNILNLSYDDMQREMTAKVEMGKRAYKKYIASTRVTEADRHNIKTDKEQIINERMKKYKRSSVESRLVESV